MRSLIFSIKFSLIVLLNIQAQTPLQRLESVSEDFIERYKQEYHEYNPLHVGDLWQFVNNSGNYSEKEIVKDTIVLNKKYYKKFEYMFIYDPYSWERNDTSNQSTYCLDIQDLDEDGDSLDEVLLDSLDVPNYTEYTSYRYTWKPWDPDPKIALVLDSTWIIVFGDTVLARIVEYIPPFQAELVADKYGVVEIYPEGSPPLLLTGMIINGVTYGIIVNVDKSQESFPSKFKLFNNYPNPFNPITNIKFRTSNFGFVSLKIYDVLGNEIKTLVNEEKPAGEYQVTFDGSNLASGIYVYQIKTNGKINSKKMILLK
jgi:Secretion system C-terminal sorting domain